MYDLPWWMMGLLCFVLVGLIVVLFILRAARANAPRRPLTDLEKDYDDEPGRDR
jgi:hypothetical protein